MWGVAAYYIYGITTVSNYWVPPEVVLLPNSPMLLWCRPTIPSRPMPWAPPAIFLLQNSPALM